jgi:hypothetical protein
MRLLALLLLAALVAGCASREEERAVADLDAIAELREQFNEDAGQPRLVLLLSPS